MVKFRGTNIRKTNFIFFLKDQLPKFPRDQVTKDQHTGKSAVHPIDELKTKGNYLDKGIFKSKSIHKLSLDFNMLKSG